MPRKDWRWWPIAGLYMAGIVALSVTHTIRDPLIMIPLAVAGVLGCLACGIE